MKSVSLPVTPEPRFLEGSKVYSVVVVGRTPHSEVVLPPEFFLWMLVFDVLSVLIL